MKKMSEDDLWDWIDSQPWSDEDFERIREMEKKGGLTEEEKEQCRKWCCKDGLP
jgi:hypothetical protein